VCGRCANQQHLEHPLTPFLDQAHGGVWRALLDKPVQLADQCLAHRSAPTSASGAMGAGIRSANAPGLQNGLSQERLQAVTATFRCALHLDHVRVPSALRQQSGTKIAARRRPPDLPARPAEVSDPLFEAFAPGCAHFSRHDVVRMAAVTPR